MMTLVESVEIRTISVTLGGRAEMLAADPMYMCVFSGYVQATLVEQTSCLAQSRAYNSTENENSFEHGG